MSFNYKTSSDQELIDHIFKSSAATVSVAKAYHKKVGNLDVVSRIDYCRSLLKQARIEERLAILQMENSKHGIIIEQPCPSVD